MNMSENIAIIVLLGSRRAGQKLSTRLNQLQAEEPARIGKSGNRTHQAPPLHRQMRLIAGYGRKLHFLSPRGQESLLEIEQDVNLQMETLHATSSNIAGILFLCSDRHTDSKAYPFKRDTSFLGFSGPTLFTKLTVVPPLPGDQWEKSLQDLVDQGMCILSFQSRSDVPLPRILARISQGMDVVRGQIDEIYRTAAAKNKRNAGQAVILLVGETLHGKSKTINRLIGKELLSVTGTVHGSTTKAIERVKVYSTSTETATTVMVAFDDTPGFRSTTREDVQSTENLMAKYKREYFAGTYPNVILLVANWESILPNAGHEFPHKACVVGRSMQSLRDSGLVDNDRVNVVVVVTKSLSSWVEFEDLKSQKDKNNAWLTEANKRRKVIADLQRAILPGTAEWETVFIENGGGREMNKFEILPDGNLSHENLYHAIRKIVESPSPYGIRDLAGIQALQVLAGAQSLDRNFGTSRQFLLSKGVIETTVPKFQSPSPDDRTGRLIDSYFGVIYDLVHGSFGRNSVLDVKDFPLQLTVPGQQNGGFEQLPTAARDPDRPEAERLRAHYSSDWGFKSAAQPNSRRYILHHIVRVVSAAETLKLSAEMMEEIDKLPRSFRESPQSYLDFFASHGTHIVVRLALGGTLRIVYSTEGGHRDRAMVFPDGAGEFSPQLIAFLEEKFRPKLNSSEWQQTRAKWVKELEKDPVFCPDHELTEYRPIHSFLTQLQKQQFQEALQVYLGKSSEHGTNRRALPRQSYLAVAVKVLRDSVTQAVMKVLQN
ncbi:hypothetical protein C8R45DRAFT_1218153 [Mycena sanguinolenta]|nr:hypothetical protein C8R45DRAFT_1218153 [Mycena sanguinolenta]